MTFVENINKDKENLYIAHPSNYRSELRANGGVQKIVGKATLPQLGRNLHLSVTGPDGIPQTCPLGKHLSHKMCKHYTTPGLISHITGD